MRIGIDVRLWEESGVGRYIRNLVSNLQVIDRNNEYVLFVLEKDYQNLKSQISNLKWRVIKANTRWHSLEEQLRFPSILNRENLDLVHFPYFSVPIFYNRPFVVTIHDLILHHFPTGEASTLPFPLYWVKLLGYKFVISQAAKKAKKIIAVSNATREEIVDHLGVNQGKVVAIYEGIDQKIRNQKSEIRNKLLNTKYKIPNTEYFLYIGNAYPHKNLERLLEAFSMINDEGLMMKLVLVGKEDYFYKRLKEKANHMGLEKSVVFYGEASDEELAHLYQNAKALVLPSFMEGFGLPAVEAMANECLVLASDIPALREVCKDSAIYFNPRSAEEIAKTMEAVHSNDTYYYSCNIKRGIERTKMFFWEGMARETLEIYESCLGV